MGANGATLDDGGASHCVYVTPGRVVHMAPKGNPNGGDAEGVVCSSCYNFEDSNCCCAGCRADYDTAWVDSSDFEGMMVGRRFFFDHVPSTYLRLARGLTAQRAPEKSAGKEAHGIRI
jgi:hypothetical protein